MLLVERAGESYGPAGSVKKGHRASERNKRSERAALHDLRWAGVSGSLLPAVLTLSGWMAFLAPAAPAGKSVVYATTAIEAQPGVRTSQTQAFNTKIFAEGIERNRVATGTPACLGPEAVYELSTMARGKTNDDPPTRYGMAQCVGHVVICLFSGPTRAA